MIKTVLILSFLFVMSTLCAQATVFDPNASDVIYRNPVIHADYSDPDVVRVGSDYYMVSSSFSHFPGLPILHSKDLVNWKIIAHATPDYPDAAFDKPHHGDAIWAPSIRFHNGEYFIYYGDPDKGVFMTKAKNPAGPWAPLKLIKKVVGWIDCTPLWDDDGKAYMVHAYANSRSGVKSILLINEMSPDGEEILGTSTLVFNGQKDHPTCEGPKLYKRNDYYYIFTPAGGVATGWQTVLRSKNIYGPYEDKIVLEQGMSQINGPHQGAWIDTPLGDDWFIHFQDKGTYGRVVCLQPMSWEDNWPVMGKDLDGNGIGEPLMLHQKPMTGFDKALPQTSDDFDGEKLGLQWQWQANPKENWYSFSGGKINLRGGVQVSQPNLWMQPNLLLQKFPAPTFVNTTKLSIDKWKKGDEAGLMVFGLDYARITAQKLTSKKLNIRVSSCLKADKGSKEETSAEVVVDGSVVFFRVQIMPHETTKGELPRAICTFQYSTDGKDFKTLGSEFIAKEGKWVGAKTGLFALGSDKLSASFEYFDVAPYKPE